MIHFKLFIVLFYFSSAGLTGIARASFVVITPFPVVNEKKKRKVKAFFLPSYSIRSFS